MVSVALVLVMLDAVSDDGVVKVTYAICADEMPGQVLSLYA